MHNKKNKKLIVVLGPTASGKSKIAIQIAKNFNGEIISADSRQVYRGMDIGTGKITKKEMENIPHHLIDVASPKRQFSTAQYQKLALKSIDQIFKKNKLPILCGGTGFYINAVIDRLAIPKVKPDRQLRAELEKLTESELFLKLKKLDPKRAQSIDKNNKRRLIRALEILIKTKDKIPPLKKEPLDYPVLILGIKKEKSELKKLIKKRLFKRLKQGMVKEVQTLKSPKKGKGLSWKKIESFGLEYRLIGQYLQGKISYNQMTESLQKEIEKYANRQLTWFRKYPGNEKIYWVKNYKEAKEKIKNFLKKEGKD